MIVRAAPAKLNLTLQVVGRRADGYHLLDSLVAFTEFGDTVEIEHADGLEFTVDGPFAAALDGPTEANLVLRAARLLAEASGVSPRAAIRLTKRLPVASGIGGGSSDAAATLLGLMALWQLQLPGDALGALALRLGADVPVCLAGITARLQGIGEIVTPAATLPPAPIVLVNPGKSLRTPDVFRALDGVFSEAPGSGGVLPGMVADSRALAHAIAPFENDLAAPAIRLCPEIYTILAALRAAPDCLIARMSGSGATCFGLYPEIAAANAAAAAIQRHQPGWWVVATRLKTWEASSPCGRRLEEGAVPRKTEGDADAALMHPSMSSGLMSDRMDRIDG